MREFIAESGEDVKVSDKIYAIISKLDPSIRNYLANNDIKEEDILVRNMSYLLKKIGVPEIVIYNAEDLTVPDIKGKKSQAIPLSPSIVLLYT